MKKLRTGDPLKVLQYAYQVKYVMPVDRPEIPEIQPLEQIALVEERAL